MTVHDVVTGALAHITAHYVERDIAAAMDAHVKRRLARGAYDALDGPDLCAAVTKDLREVYDDRHLSLDWHDEPRHAAGDWRERFRREGQAVRRVERLEPNIGLLALEGFGDPRDTGPVYEAVFRLLAHTEAMILDLRVNHGGWPWSAVQLIGYFLDGEPVRLRDIRTAGEVRQQWSPAALPGPRYTAPLWVLTSAKTFSGGEDAAYTLQSLGRARVVGETTAGAANAFEVYPVTANIDAFVPNELLVDARTGGNWEGVGVRPDVPVAAADALTAALAEARA
ncbi:S41 family peptidase [Actinorhabdospora filicis]|uniref:S41 family peptidase n=1 Tax=Actinorhabdospora filicis TaxID=1785913 RepID=UPI0025532747|nr:S41 family peptidase [Actinorhabdospora filicis]